MISLFVAFYVDIVFPPRYHNYPSSMKFELLDDAVLSLAQNMHWMHFSNHHHLSRRRTGAGSKADTRYVLIQHILEGLQQLLGNNP